MDVNISQLLTKRLNKVDDNFKHYSDDMAYLTLTTRNDNALKDLLSIQLLRNAKGETVARELSRLDLAVLEENVLTDIIKLKSVYVQDFEAHPTQAESNAIKAIKKDLEDNLNKITQPPKSWTYRVSEQAKLHFAAIYIDVDAKEKFELPETKTLFLREYPELKEGDLVYKSIARHRLDQDQSIEGIVEPKLYESVFEPLLTSDPDLVVKKGSIDTLYTGKYTDFKVTVYLQVFEVGYFDETEVVDEVEVETISTDSEGNVVVTDEVIEAAATAEPEKKEDKKDKKKKDKDNKKDSKKNNKKDDKKKDKKDNKKDGKKSNKKKDKKKK